MLNSVYACCNPSTRPSLSFQAYRRIRTTIILPIAFGATTARQVVTIDPRDLEAALARDTQSVR
jgi:hypothetical protein